MLENSSKIEYNKKMPTKEVCPGTLETSTAPSGRRVQGAPLRRTPLLEGIWNRGRGENTTKEMAAEEVPHKSRKADAARYRALSEMKSTEKELREWMLDEPGPRSTVTEQTVHPVITVKLTPDFAERIGVTTLRSVQGCGRGGKCLMMGHLLPVRVLLLQMRAQRDSLVKATAGLNEAVPTAGGGSWAAPLELMREALVNWLRGQKARVRKLKENIEGRRGWLIMRGGEQRKKGGCQEKAPQPGPARVAREKPEKIQGEQQVEEGTSGHPTKPG